MASVGDQQLLAAAGREEQRGILPLFATTLFVSALLLFWVQPMFSRMVLPALGGSPAVWNTAMVFFQTALLAGYALRPSGQPLARPRRQVALHLGLSAVAALTLPIAIGPDWTPPTEGTPVLWLIALLAWCRSACRSSWWRRPRRCCSNGSRRAATPAGRDPYFLYGASNLGSMLALLGYPLLLEPLLTLDRQRRGLGARLCRAERRWSRHRGLAVLAAAQAGDGHRQMPRAATADAPGWGQRLHWLALAFAPSSLLLAVTALHHDRPRRGAAALGRAARPLSVDLRDRVRAPAPARARLDGQGAALHA